MHHPHLFIGFTATFNFPRLVIPSVNKKIEETAQNTTQTELVNAY